MTPRTHVHTKTETQLHKRTLSHHPNPNRFHQPIPHPSIPRSLPSPSYIAISRQATSQCRIAISAMPFICRRYTLLYRCPECGEGHQISWQRYEPIRNPFCSGPPGCDRPMRMDIWEGEDLDYDDWTLAEPADAMAYWQDPQEKASKPASAAQPATPAQPASPASQPARSYSSASLCRAIQSVLTNARNLLLSCNMFP